MEWLSDLYGKTVALDTAPLIYFIEEHPSYLSLVDPLFGAISTGDIHAVTSTVTVLEVLVQPLRQQNQALASQYRDLLTLSRHLIVKPVTTAIAERAAALRAKYNLRSPDSLQVATAIEASASHFITNDAALNVISEISVLTLSGTLSMSL